MGVPVIGCDCRVCTSTHPRNQRTRPSVLLNLPGGQLLIDTTPEMRLQLVREKVRTVHSILYTHYHVDHLYGLDDARVFPKYLNGPLPVYCTDAVENVIRSVFAYAFTPHNAALPAGFLPKMEFRRIDYRPFELLGQRVIPIPLMHGRLEVFGFRFDNVAYCTDVNHIPDESWPLLENLDVLILDTLRDGAPHSTHFNLEQALEVVDRLQPKQTYLTHMSHDIEYVRTSEILPDRVALAYDGLRFDF